MPRRWYAAAMARTRGKGDVNRRRRRDPERNLEGERRDLKRDRMARQLGLADPSHQESGAGEQPRFRQDGQADRGSDPQHLEETAPFGAPPIAEQAIAAQAPVALDDDDIGELDALHDAGDEDRKSTRLNSSH